MPVNPKRDAERVMQAALERICDQPALIGNYAEQNRARDALAEVRALPAGNTETEVCASWRRTAERLADEKQAAEARLTKIAELADSVLGELDDLVVEREEWADTHGDVFEIRRLARGEEASE